MCIYIYLCVCVFVCVGVLVARASRFRLGARAELAGDTSLLALANSLRSDPADLVREARTGHAFLLESLTREACASSIGQIGRADKGGHGQPQCAKPHP